MQNITIKSQRIVSQLSKYSYQSFCLTEKHSHIYQPTQNLLITNFKYKNGSKNSKKHHLSASAIHSTRQDTISSTKKRMSVLFDTQIPHSQRMNYLRVTKTNSFNRRSYLSKTSEKNGLYENSLRKCRSTITRVQIAKVVRTMIAKKELTQKELITKNESFREQIQFLDQLKCKLINQSDLVKNAVNVKKIILSKPCNLNKNYQPRQKVERQNISLRHFHFKLKRVKQEDNSLKPWGATKKIDPQQTISIQLSGI